MGLLLNGLIGLQRIKLELKGGARDRRLDPLRQMESELLLPARNLELGPEGREDWVVLDELTRQALLISELDNCDNNGLSVRHSLECLVKGFELRYAENCLFGILLGIIILRLAGL